MDLFSCASPLFCNPLCGFHHKTKPLPNCLKCNSFHNFLTLDGYWRTIDVYEWQMTRLFVFLKQQQSFCSWNGVKERKSYLGFVPKWWQKVGDPCWSRFTFFATVHRTKTSNYKHMTARMQMVWTDSLPTQVRFQFRWMHRRVYLNLNERKTGFFRILDFIQRA